MPASTMTIAINSVVAITGVTPFFINLFEKFMFLYNYLLFYIYPVHCLQSAEHTPSVLLETASPLMLPLPTVPEEPPGTVQTDPAGSHTSVPTQTKLSPHAARRHWFVHASPLFTLPSSHASGSSRIPLPHTPLP